MADIAISAAQVKALREASGMGMMECKKALLACDGDFDSAQDWLRVKSGAKADKVASRQASEGKIAFASHNGVGVLVEVSCETDFVARDENIAAFASAVADAVAAAGSIPDDINTLPLANGQNAEEMRQNMVMKLGENISIRNVKAISTSNSTTDGNIAAYIHSGDKIAAMCTINGDIELGRDICMHIAAMQPRYLNTESVPENVIARERDVFTQQAVESGKSAEMAEKIVAGKLNKHLAEITLMQQPFVKDTEQTIAQVLKKADASITAFELLIVGAAS